MTPSLPITPAQLRLDFPEFANNQTLFPDGTINFWSNVAQIMLNAPRWGGMLPFASELFIAHNLSLQALALQEGNAGGIPGLNRGAIAAEAGGKLSVGYDTTASTIAGAGHWNLTTYGTRLKEWMLIYGRVPIVVGCGPGYGGFIGLWTGNIPIGPGWCEGGNID